MNTTEGSYTPLFALVAYATGNKSFCLVMFAGMLMAHMSTTWSLVKVELWTVASFLSFHQFVVAVPDAYQDLCPDRGHPGFSFPGFF